MCPEQHRPESRGLEFIVDSAPVGFIQLDEARRIVNANTAFHEFIGYSPAELRQKTMFDITHPDDVAESRAVSEKFRDPNYRLRRLEKRYVRKDGRVVWGLVTSQQRTDPVTGERNLFTVIEDITELKQRESDLKRAEADLLRFFDVSLDIFLVISFEGVVTRVNTAFSTLFGYAPGEVEGKSIFDFIHPEDTANSLVQLKGLTLGYPSIRFENRCRTKGGDFRLLSWNSASDVETKRIFTSGRDITNKKHDELKLAYSAKMASLGEMAGGIAHEINNPLAIILGKLANIKGMIQNGHLNEELIRDELDGIERTGMRIAKIIRGLRSFARNDEADPMTKVSLARVLEETLELSAERLRSRSIQLEIASDPGLYVNGRPSQLCQVLMNLISNAYDAVEGVPAPRIRIELRRSGDHAVISVEDNGSGISAAHREKLMQPFFTTKEVGKGIGLGLSISKGIMEGHGGSLRFDEAAPRTRFVAELPLLP